MSSHRGIRALFQYNVFAVDTDIYIGVGRIIDELAVDGAAQRTVMAMRRFVTQGPSTVGQGGAARWLSRAPPSEGKALLCSDTFQQSEGNHT